MDIDFDKLLKEMQSKKEMEEVKDTALKVLDEVYNDDEVRKVLDKYLHEATSLMTLLYSKTSGDINAQSMRYIVNFMAGVKYGLKYARENGQTKGE